MPPIASDALVLRTYKLGETSKVVVLLTRERGKVRAVAKGARGRRSRYQSALEPLRKSGWIRVRSGDDRRERRWSLTPAGERKRVEVAPNWEAAQARLRGKIGAGRFQSLLSELAVVAEAVRDTEADKGPRARRHRRPDRAKRSQ